MTIQQSECNYCSDEERYERYESGQPGEGENKLYDSEEYDKACTKAKTDLNNATFFADRWTNVASKARGETPCARTGGDARPPPRQIISIQRIWLIGTNMLPWRILVKKMRKREGRMR